MSIIIEIFNKEKLFFVAINIKIAKGIRQINSILKLFLILKLASNFEVTKCDVDEKTAYITNILNKLKISNS